MNPYPLSEKELFPFRPKPFYFITTCDPQELTYEKALESLCGLKDRGFGGIVLFNKPPHGFTGDGYLSDEWFEMVRTFCRACREMSLPVWINDGYDFPPGGVLGRVKKLDGTLSQKRILLENGELTVKEAEWGYPAFEYPRAGELFRQLVHEEYLNRVGEYFGDPVVGFFSDADNRKLNAEVMFVPDSPQHDFFPWPDNFEQTFREAYGYDILPFMPAVIRRENIPQAVDYWEHAGHLYQSWFEGNHQWLQEHGLEYTGHSGDTSPFLYSEAPRSSALTEGRFSDIQSHFDYPGTDQELLAVDGGLHMRASVMYSPKMIWGEPAVCPRMKNYGDPSEDTRAKQAGSTAVLLRKKGAMCEMFAASNFGVSPQELRQISAFQMMQGITFVVPHAYHYRFLGVTKYFAPPDFSGSGTLEESIRELNHVLAERCCLMSRGDPIVPVALLDPTEWVWRNQFDGKAYFKAFSSLNRSPYGFVIAGPKLVLERKDLFRVAVVAGYELNPVVKAELEAAGIKVLNAEKLSCLAELLPDCTARWEGEGTPHFVRRKIEGQEFVFIANIEQTEPIHGVLSACGRREELTVFPGDILYISKDFDNLPAVPAVRLVEKIPRLAEVTFEEENQILLERFEWEGKILTKLQPSDRLDFFFTVSEPLSGLKFHLPVSDTCRVSDVLLDGMKLCEHSEKVFDEPYRCFVLPGLSSGRYCLTLNREGAFAGTDRVFLSGEFDAEVTTDRTRYADALVFYNMTVSIPEKAEVILRARRSRLSTEASWAEQGQPFYSGTAVYRFRMDLPQNGKYRLSFPKIRDVAELTVNGLACGKCCWSPYRFEFEAEAGPAEFALWVTNSLANEMEGWREESGILQGGVLEILSE